MARRTRQRDDGNPYFIEFHLADSSALALEWNYTDRAEKLYQAGHRLMTRGFLDDALGVFERATRYDRAHYLAYVGRTEVLVMLGRIEEAARVADAALERYGRNCEVGAARGHVFLHQGDLDHALECAEIAQRNAPDSAYVRLIGGETRLPFRDNRPAFEAAMDCFALARQAEVPWPNLDLRIPLAMLEWGYTEHAARSLDALTRARPDVALAWILLGEALRTLGDRRRARECYARAAELVPELKSRRRPRRSVWRRLLGRAMCLAVPLSLSSCISHFSFCIAP